MQISETTEILKRVATVDNRKVTPEVIEAWHDILSGIPFATAKEALRLAQSDANVKYLEPRHIVGWAKEAAWRLERNKPAEEIEIKVGDPEPTCKRHNLKVTTCRPCCRHMARMEHLTPGQLLLWAKEEIYA